MVDHRRGSGRTGSLRRLLLSRARVAAQGAGRTASSAIFSRVQRDAPLAAPRGRASDHAQRVGRGLRKPANWVQLLKFGAVGASDLTVPAAVPVFRSQMRFT